MEEVTDLALTSGDMMALVYSQAKNKNYAAHHIESMNIACTTGISQIITQGFQINDVIVNERDQTDEDKEISEINIRVEFSNVDIKPPSTTIDNANQPQYISPHTARLLGLTYSSHVFISAKITAEAVLKNSKETKTRTAIVTDHPAILMPCMVKSQHCYINHASITKEGLRSIYEDPNDPGGYMIINGNEWVIDCIESVVNNLFRVFRNLYQNEVVRGEIISKPGDAFENSYITIIRLLNTGEITVEITTSKVNKILIPFYIVFRLLGITRDIDIVNTIVYDTESSDPIVRQMMERLEKAYNANNPTFAKLRNETYSANIAVALAGIVNKNAESPNARKDEDIQSYLVNSIEETFDRYFLPHMGSTRNDRIGKLRFLGHLIRRVLLVDMGVIRSTDRDSYEYKRVNSSGIALMKTFKTQFHFLIRAVRKALRKEMQSLSFSNVNLGEVFKKAMSAREMEKHLAKAISSGNKIIYMKKQAITNRLSSQALHRKNPMNTLSVLNNINSPNSAAGKQNERSDAMRQMHPTYIGYIDITQSNESGEKIGMSKQIAVTCTISESLPAGVIKTTLLQDSDVTPLHLVDMKTIHRKKLSAIFVNGAWIGCTSNHFLLGKKYRLLRREGRIGRTVSIECKLTVNEIYFWSDPGRPIRPLLIVYNNQEEYDREVKAGKSPEFRQWIRLKKSHVKAMMRNEVTVDQLVEEGIMEYISAGEQLDCLLASSIDVLREHANDVTTPFTHCDIPQALFGVVSLSTPRADHSSSVRNVYYTNHRRQACGWYACNFPHRMEKNVTMQHYIEYPLVATISDAISLPCSQNCIVALMAHDGWDQEDSAEVNQSSIDCGLFNASYYTRETVELESNEQWGNPDPTKTLDIRSDADYSKVASNNGIIKEGTIVTSGTILVQKVSMIARNREAQKEIYVDKSLKYKKDEVAIVDKVVMFNKNKGVKVRLRSDRPLRLGDKISSRTANKSIVTKLTDSVNMPYTEDGITPDVIVNMNSIPTRMALNQLIECLEGQSAAASGVTKDATIFRDVDIDGLIKKLEEEGIQYAGHKRMYDGRTGKWYDSLIFVGPTVYQRIQKFVIDENRAMRTGPTSSLTHQPLEGKSRDGGLKLGEMEKDDLASHGIMTTLREKMYKDSDGTTMYICKVCGLPVVVNESRNIYWCKRCEDKAKIYGVESTWVFNLLREILGLMGIGTKFELSKLEI